MKKFTIGIICFLTGISLSSSAVFAEAEVGPGVEKPASTSDILISDMYHIYVRGTDDKTAAGVLSALSKIDPDVLRSFTDAGGKIYLKDYVFFNGSEVKGLTTFNDKMILVSIHDSTASDAADGISEILLHEFGHYIYEFSPMSDAQRSEIYEIYADWNKYNPYFYNDHETYAQLYRYIKTDSNFMDYLPQGTGQTVLDIEELL